MTGKVGRPGGNNGGGRRSRPDARRHNVMVSNAVWEWLNREGNPGKQIDTLAEDEMKSNVETRLAELGFDPDQIETITEWWNVTEHADWLTTASRQEIITATLPAWEPYGTVTVDGIEYQLTENAYCTSRDISREYPDGDHFEMEADAFSPDGNLVSVRWFFVDDGRELDEYNYNQAAYVR